MRYTFVVCDKSIFEVCVGSKDGAGAAGGANVEGGATAGAAVMAES